MLKFRGLLDDLKHIVMRCAIPGEWSFHKNSTGSRPRAARS
jgi:hypothetical protein